MPYDLNAHLKLDLEQVYRAKKECIEQSKKNMRCVR